MPLNLLPDEQNVTDKRRKSGRENNSHGPTSEVALVDVDLVIFGRFEIKPWYPSPFVLDPLESHQSLHFNQDSNSNSRLHSLNKNSNFQKQSSSTNPRFQNLDSTKISHLEKHPSVHYPKNKESSKFTNLLQSSSDIIQKEILVEGSSDRSQSPDSSYSLKTGSAPPRNFLSNQLPLNIPKPKSLSPSSTSKINSDAPSQLRHPPSYPNTNRSDSTLSSSRFLKLYVCDGCLKYLVSLDSFRQHKIQCKMTHPPGRKVYQNGKVIIREVDGSKAKLYCQCLCLFGKLFIDHKYIFFDVEGFKFYVLSVEEKLITTIPNGVIEMGTVKQKKESIMGFFSKEKISYDGYNLACIVTLPPYQKKGFGTLLIAFSYELDRFESSTKDENGLPSQESLYLGTPERPLSTLGAKGYLSFWTAVLVRFLRTLFPPPPPIIHQEFNHTSTTSNGFGDQRRTFNSGPSKMIEMTLEEISRSTRLRPDDAAFALISSGLTRFSKKRRNQNQCILNDSNHANSSQIDPVTNKNDQNHQEEKFSNGDVEEEEVIIITRDLVEQVAQKAKVKSAAIDPRHILINYNNFNNHDNDDDDDDLEDDEDDDEDDEDNKEEEEDDDDEDEDDRVHQIHQVSNLPGCADSNFDHLTPPTTR